MNTRVADVTKMNLLIEWINNLIIVANFTQIPVSLTQLFKKN